MWKAHPTHQNIELHPDGLARNTATRRRLKGWVNGKGYTRVWVNGKSLRLHRLVLETFVPCRDPAMHAAHIDHDKTNNRLDNLKWLTATENNRENATRGAIHNSALTPEEGAEFWRLREAGAMPKALGERFGKSRVWATQVIRHGYYRHTSL
jgi:hypothetical protein